MEKRGFIILPESVAKRGDLSLGAKLLYGFINSYSKKNDKCWASNQYIADYFSTDVRTVSRWLKKLKDKELITIQKEYKAGRVTKRHIYIKKESSKSKDIKKESQKSKELSLSKLCSIY